jgi:crotonobetainyl-CoA:carnitine CoA-transferase CaiB-like acyl-CoA transferase
VPNGPVNTLQDVAAHDQARVNGTFEVVEHALGGDLQTVAPPIRINGPWHARCGPPALGADTEAVLSALPRA